MATQDTGGGSTTSFTNTPQAKDDSYNYIEDTLYNDALLYNRTSKTIFLDVMANDLGGNAKTLFSVDDGGTGALTDLLKKETAWEQTADGNWIRVYNGKIEFKIGDGTNNIDNARDLNSLAAGECVDDTFVYAIRMANGTLAYATVTIKIEGQNDAVELGAVSDATITDTAADDAPFADITGTLTSTDPDLGDTPTYGLADAVASDLAGYDLMKVTDYGTLYLNSVTGAYTFVADAAAIQALDSGDADVLLNFAVSVTDGDTTDSDTLTITIDGANDAVELGAVTDATITDTAADDAPFADITGSLVGSDRDAGETLTYGLDDSEPSELAGYDLMKVTGYGTLYLNSTSGQYTFVANAGAIQALDSDDADVLLNFAVSVSDGDTTAGDTLTITIDGANDTPEVANVIADQSVNEDTEWEFQVPANTFSDRDAGEVLTYSVTLEGGGDLPSWLEFDAATRTFSGTPPADFNGTLNLTVTASDGDESASDTFTLTIIAVNDAPVNSMPGGYSTDEDVAKQLTGLSVADVDAGAGAITVTLSVSSGTLAATSGGGVTVTNSGTSSIQLSGTVAAINAFLAAASAPVFMPAADANGNVTLTMATNDNGFTGLGGAQSDSDSVTISVAAVNDAALVTGDDTGEITEDAVPNTVGGNLDSTDVDGTDDSWEADTIAGDYGSLTINADGTWTYTLDNDNAVVDALDDDSDPLTDTITVKTEDGTEHDIVITINGNTDATDVLAPTDIRFNLASTVGGLTGGSLAANATLGSFTAVDGDSTSWTFELSGDDAALFTLSPTSGGSVNLVTGGSAIADGTYTFTVKATDSGGNFYTETFTVSVGTTGGDGAVIFTVTAGSDLSFGLNGNDTINGGDGEDALVGGNNVDTLNGGLGNDQLFGGAQSDTFIFNTAIGPAANVDQILDFDAGGGQADKIHLDDAVFAGLTNGNLAANFQSSATGTFSGTAKLQYNSTTGELFYDPDGADGAAEAILFAKITLVGGTLDSTDFVII